MWNVWPPLNVGLVVVGGAVAGPPDCETAGASAGVASATGSGRGKIFGSESVTMLFYLE